MLRLLLNKTHKERFFNMKKIIASVAFLLVICMPQASHAQDVPVTTTKQAYMIDFETGAILLDKDSNVKMPTSSMSKVMTMYMVFNALKNN